MSLIDLHCDTISRLMDAPKGECLAVNQLSIDVEGMESAGTLAQFFACFVNAVSFENKNVHTRGTEPISSEAWERAYLAVLAMADRLEQEQNEKIRVAHSAEEITTNSVNGVISLSLIHIFTARCGQTGRTLYIKGKFCWFRENGGTA